MFKNTTTKPPEKKKDVQVRECNLIPMSTSPLYDRDIRDKRIKVSESKGYILRDIESLSCLYFIFLLEIILQIVILLWLFMATKEKLEYEDFVGLTEWEKG
jgi:hypothetical protein